MILYYYLILESNFREQFARKVGARGDAERRNTLCCELGFCVCILMCYYFINYVNWSVGERFDSLNFDRGVIVESAL